VSPNASRLNHAIKQVDEWDYWIKRNESYFKDSLLKAINKIDSSFNKTFEHTRRFIVNRKIVIGSRATLSDGNNKRRFIEYDKSGLDIATYDRLIEIKNKIT
jgi:hypothetical protein